MNKISRESDTAIIKTTAQLMISSGPAEGTSIPLHSGQITTIGRATTNRLVIPDEICSRSHCEVFFDSGIWKLRDLGSRNGTRVNGEPISGDVQLTEGREFQIGNTTIVFSLNPKAKSTSVPKHRHSTDYDPSDDTIAKAGTETVRTPQPVTSEGRSSAESRSSADTHPEIVHHCYVNPFVEIEPNQQIARGRAGHEAQRLVQLGLKMGEESDVRRLSEIVLDGLFNVTSADIGAVLLFNESNVSHANHRNLELVAFKSLDSSRQFERVSDYVTNTVLESRAAVVAHDIKTDGEFSASESLKEMRVESIICAPIRTTERLLGMIQLYSTNDNRLKAEDAEFTLAVADQLAVTLENLKERSRLAAVVSRVEIENKTLREQLLIETELVGDSDSIRRLRERILRIAPTGATVLIRGESGVGKELVARAIHQHSNRADGPFVTMNSAALSESLLESELFGHVKGSFTGAYANRAGRFEIADKGTLFLDEIGDMKANLQVKLLRVLQNREFEPVGASKSQKVDVRIVAATNKKLEELVATNDFREDLYYRLSVIPINIPPLRERKEDIPILIHTFLTRFNEDKRHSVKGFSRDALDILCNYVWPGNVRELENLVERLVILKGSGLVVPEDLP
ncbi:MAG: sigma 54-interacting transcriptional regulator, partial [Schlesneria sp.]